MEWLPNGKRNKVKKKSPSDIAAFNVRTAKIIRRNIPDARIAGLSLANNDAGFLEECLKAMDEDINLFEWMIYHGYCKNPDASYDEVERQKAVLRKYSAWLFKMVPVYDSPCLLAERECIQIDELK